MSFRIRVAALVVALLTLAVLTSFAIISTDGAAAARYVVTQCGWHVGQDADWAENASGRYLRSSYCQTPDSADPFDGVHLSSEVKGAAVVGGTRYARWRWQAPAGAAIVAVHGQRWQFVRDGFEHRIGSVSSGGSFAPFLSLAQSDSTRRDFSSAFAPFAQAFESRLLCAKPSDRQCRPDGTVLAGIRALTLTLDDPNRPGARIGGGLAGSDWLRGTQSLSFEDSDVGSGLRFAETAVDGAVRARSELSCAKVQITGQWRGRTMRPCSLAGSGSQSVDTRGLTDGPHLLRHCAIDFAGNQGCSPDRTIWVDNNPPSAPRGLAVEGGEGWHRTNGFDLTWTDPDQGRASPIAASWLRLTSDRGSLVPSSRFGSGGVEVEVPGPGVYLARVWLADWAGNTNEANHAEVTLKLDDVPPTGYFLDPPADDPELIRAPISDAYSGVAGGTISWRSAGGDEWHEVPTRLDGGAEPALVARVPSLPRGSWVLRAAIVDRAGNLTVTDRRANGSRMEVRTPLREETRLSAGLSKENGRVGGAVRVAYGRRALLAGRLTDGRGGLSAERVIVTESPYPGSRWAVRRRSVPTDGRGDFEIWLEAGPGRRVEVSFPGTKQLEESSSGTLEMRVAGRLRFSVRPRRLRTGERALFRGRVASLGAWPPRRGNLVQVEYFEMSARRWRPVALVRTDREGRFRGGYRFRYITGLARIRLRARLVPAPRFPYVGAVSRPVVIRVRG
ncbi:MAG: hypothetical protein J0H98_10940 [Solirubrobacterales bacterium]|nr:hypothetical protein [Solirubrobacterales bacterium]